MYTGTTLEGHHFYNPSNQPTWTLNDPSTGRQLGLVSGMAQVKVAVPKQPGDGGYGSVAEVLLIAVKAEGESRPSTDTMRWDVHAHNRLCCGQSSMDLVAQWRRSMHVSSARQSLADHAIAVARR